MSASLCIGVIGDDLTGSSDIANTLARAGARTVQHVGLPAGPARPGIEAAVVALKSRTAPVADAVRDSLAACDWLRANGARQIVFKICSTFDSTPLGNIGPVAEALAEVLGAGEVLVCPAFPANGRTVYMGHLFVKDRLLSESGMERHPLTPMTDPDLRRWLARQTRLPVGHLPLAALHAGAAAAPGRQLVVADAIADADLLALGRRAAGAPLLVGGSGLALGLPANFGIAARPPAPFPGIRGPALILSGSCSQATLGQVAAWAGPRLGLTDEMLADPEAAFAAAWAFIAANRERVPLVASTAPPETVAAAQARRGREALAEGFEALFARLARAALAAGFRRLVVAGGETSGAVAGVLGPVALEIGPEIATGVPALLLDGPDPVALAFKSGNFGGPDFFADAVAALAGTPPPTLPTPPRTA
jgi:uncharacterized protein YgbK (DUF1537 family)